MNARLSLLVLVVITFMAIWDADRQSKPVSPPRVPHQPLSWHLPLPVTPDAAVRSATPIVVPTITDVRVHEEVSEVTPVAVVEGHITEETTTPDPVAVAETKTEEIPTDEPQSSEHSPSPSETETTVSEVNSTASAPANLAKDTETLAIESQPVAEASIPSTATEVVDIAKTGEVIEEPAVEAITEPLKASEPASEVLPPEKLQTTVHWDADRILQLSRSAQASHEQTSSPISPELFEESIPNAEPVITKAEPQEEGHVVAEENATTNVDPTTINQTPKTEAPGVDASPKVEYLPVPKNLASGTWQLISQDGEMLQITITRQEEPSGDVELSDKYATGTDPKGKRWGFIRVQKSADEAGKVAETPAETPVSEPDTRPVQKAATEFFSPSTR
ncbi:MAG: hypothetical protein JNM43_07660 [Planctomycetaceae bacterium]|nr:hypothetical protein [Planctomycetaceae bacterium]